jgi:hypothetical protein
MLNHSVSVSVREEDLGFAIMDLPSTGEELRWDGTFSKVCAKKISPSCYVMKFNGEDGVEYYQFKWGVPQDLSRLTPRWIPVGHAFKDPEMAIHHAQLDMADALKIVEHPLPESEISN